MVKGVVESDEKFIIWTTTPWTMPANLAIAVNPELQYSVVAVDGAKYIVASELVETVQKRLNGLNMK